MTERLYLYDTTLRDGAQTSGVNFSPADKQAIAADLDALGVDYIEGGWPGANPTDDAFFADPPKLTKAKFCAFGMTRRAGRSAANDPGLVTLFQAKPDVITLVGKSSAVHAEGALGVDRDENLRMIEESMAESTRHADEVMYDAEHFFDGYKHDAAYATECVARSLAGGARWAVLCDTNGGTLPHEVTEIVGAMVARFGGDRIGIHTHNDTENAVANSLAAIRAGARQVQGTLNGLGERCGNANLVSLIPTLMLKMGFDLGLNEDALVRLTHISRNFDERLNRTPNRSAAYVGANAFAHKGGLHASAVAKNPQFYEHTEPAIVGNTRDILISNQAGRANLLQRCEDLGLSIDPRASEISEVLETIKNHEARGFSYDGASASFELLLRRKLEHVADYFNLISFRVIDESRYNAMGERVTISEATIKVQVNGTSHYCVAEGNGPVNALDSALRQALAQRYPSLNDMELLDYKVRILSPEAGTAALTRVIIESGDEEGRVWQTVGVSGNIIKASYNALRDAITYKLLMRGVEPA